MKNHEVQKLFFLEKNWRI